MRPRGLKEFTIIWAVLILTDVALNYSLKSLKGLHYPPVMQLMPLVWLLVLYALWKGKSWARQLLIILLSASVLYALFSTEIFPVLWFNYATGILGVYSLYWLNMSSVRKYFASDNSPKGLGNRLLSVCASIMVGLYAARVICAIIPSFWITNFGSAAWAHTKADLTARGEKLTFAELVPQKVPPNEENFFADPLWMELLETKQVLENGTWIQKPVIDSKDRAI